MRRNRDGRYYFGIFFMKDMDAIACKSCLELKSRVEKLEELVKKLEERVTDLEEEISNTHFKVFAVNPYSPGNVVPMPMYNFNP